jgi:hypothetical protein
MATFSAAGVCGSLGPAEPTLLSNVLFPMEDGGYTRFDVLLASGKIAFIGAAGEVTAPMLCFTPSSGSGQLHNPTISLSPYPVHRRCRPSSPLQPH